MAISSLLVPMPSIPQPNFSWLDGISKSIGGAIDDAREDNSFAGLADRLQGQQSAQPATSSLLSRLAGGAQPQSQTYAAPPIGKVDRGPAQGSTYQPFIDTVRGQVSNPNALAAIAATGRAESGWGSDKANSTWSDPSQSGQAGTSGGILSWRGPRLASLQSYAASKGEQGNGSPQTQAEFFLQENPQLIQSLNGARSPQEAADIMANAWRFAGYNQQGGEAARRRAIAQNYYAQEFGRGNAGSAAIEAAAPGSGAVDPTTLIGRPYAPGGQPQDPTLIANLASTMVSSGQPQGSFDNGRFASGPVARGTDRLASAMAAAPQGQYRDPAMSAAGYNSSAPNPGAIPTQPVARPQPAPVQVADASNSPTIVAQGVAPFQRGQVPNDIIQYMLRNKDLRQAGLQLWAQNVKGATEAPWDFGQLADGTLVRRNKQTGEIQSFGNFAKPGKPGGGEYGLQPIYGTDENGNTGIGQIGKDGSFHLVDTKGFKPVGNTTQQNLGTTYQTRDKAGNVISTTPIDVAGKKDQETTGKANSEARSAFPQVEASGNQMLATIDSLAGDPYLSSMLGPVAGRTWNLSSDAARVQSKLDQIGGQSFLQAYNMLRGGGAITDIEGQKATAAMSRLTTTQNVNDFRQALQELRDIVSSGIQRARKRAGGTTGPQVGTIEDGYRFKGGDPSVQDNWEPAQ